MTPGDQRWRSDGHLEVAIPVRALTLGSSGPIQFEDRTHREVDLRMQSVPYHQHKGAETVVKGPGRFVTGWSDS